MGFKPPKNPAHMDSLWLAYFPSLYLKTSRASPGSGGTAEVDFPALGRSGVTFWNNFLIRLKRLYPTHLQPIQFALHVHVAPPYPNTQYPSF